MPSMRIEISREMFSDYYLLTFPNGYSEEVEVLDIYPWFQVRGAKQELVEKPVDYAFNFGKAAVTILNYREPPGTSRTGDPKL